LFQLAARAGDTEREREREREREEEREGARSLGHAGDVSEILAVFPVQA
jgi:hypothetical protein